jgi:hypothetical protein
MSDNSNIDIDDINEKNSHNLIIQLQESFSSSNKSNNEHEIAKALKKTPIESKTKDHILQKESYQEHDIDKTLFTSENSEVKKNTSSNSVNLKYQKNKYFASTENNSIILPNPQSPKKKKYTVFKMVEKERYKQYFESPTKNVKIEEEIETGRERRDYYGTEIKRKNRRKIKISFVDEIDENKPLAEVINIESFKKYNYIFGMPSEANFNHNIKTNCQCCITF